MKTEKNDLLRRLQRALSIGAKARSLVLLAGVGVATTAALVNCAAPAEEEEESPSEDAITGVNNALGLGLRYDDKSGTVHATLNKPLADGQRLFIRLRRGKLEMKQDASGKLLTPSQQVDCGDLAQARPIDQSKNEREVTGKVVYQGPKVDKALFDLVNLYEDEGWADDTVSPALKDEVKRLGPTPIVEACIMKGGKVAAKLATNLAYAWDQGTKAEGQASLSTQSLHPLAGDGGVEEQPGLNETNVNSQIEYAQLCVEQLGEIPFFKKVGEGKYDTFDCRDMVGVNAEGQTGPMPGVEGARIPVTVDGVQATECSPGRELGRDSESYGCMDKADHGMFLASGQTQPGPMIATAKNEKGTHWVLLCRKVADDGTGMMNTKIFNDFAMIGHNPRTGRTCFFQNDIGTGRDGAHVPHPGDVEKSTTVWSTGVQSYCSGACHAESAFVHSPWIDGAKRSDGHPIVPKAGEHPDFPISDLSHPYNIVAADHLGFKIPQQLVSDEVGACNNCHRLAGDTLDRFAKWSTGTGNYFDWITETGKKFENSHWMPPRLNNLDEASWGTSQYGKALDFMARCSSDHNAEGCLWADVPRGEFNNPAVRP